MKYRKKPVVIEARKLDLTDLSEQLSDLHEWITGKKIHWADVVRILISHTGYPIETLEGAMLAKPGDYIIKGINGEFYPCKPDIFEKTYEAVDDTNVEVEFTRLSELTVKNEIANHISAFSDFLKSFHCYHFKNSLDELSRDYKGREVDWDDVTFSKNDIKNTLRLQISSLMNIAKLLKIDDKEIINTNWISVKDKLPQYNLTVLICYGEARVIDTALLHQSNAGDYWVMNGKYIDIELVTHWQPLPKLPQA